MTKNRVKNIAALTTRAICVASLVVVLLQAYFYFNSLRETARSAHNLMTIEAQRDVERLVIQLKKIERAVLPIAQDLSDGRISEAVALTRLEKAKSLNPLIASAGVLPQDSPEPWVKDCLKRSACWTDPARLKTGDLGVVFGVPFKNGAEKSGIVFAAVSIDAIADIASAFAFGDTGYGYILSSNGAFVYYPMRETVETGRTLIDIISQRKTADTARVVEATKRALGGHSAILDIANPVTNQRLRLFYMPIPETGWSLGAIFSVDELSGDKGFLRRQMLWLVFYLVIFLTCLVAVAAGVHHADPWRLWIVSIAASLLCIAGSVYIWYATLSAPLIEEKDKRVFTDTISVGRFTDEHSRAMAALGRKTPAYIPTGILIQSLEFTGSNDLYVTGYIWQKYTDGIHDAVQRGFRLPEARSVNIREAYRKKSDKVETIGWYFEATIRQRFDYSRYPFDRPNIWVWFKPADFMNNVVLIPDLSAYKILSPAALPGIQEKLALPGYTFLGSFFDYEYHSRRVNLGIVSRGQMERIPELYYNIVVKRNFITPFVSKLFPLLIMFSILFVVQLMFSQEEEKKKAFGFSALAVMGVIITFFFSTLLSHNNLRQDLNADKIIFIENFHFIAYCVLLLVAIKTLLFMGGSRVRIVQYRQGLIPKLLYWPICTALIFLISFISFY